MPDPDFRTTIITPLLRQTQARPDTLPALLSYARSEFLDTQNAAAPFMAQVTELFTRVARSVFNSSFVWSEYNLGQWRRFCDCKANSADGGLCIFSMTPAADYNAERIHDFLGVGLGVPTGTRPYAIWSVNPAHGNRFREILPTLLRELALQPV